MLRFSAPLVFLLCASVASAQSVPDGLLGRWAGAAIENGTPKLFELTFDRAADGSLSTELTLPYNGYDQFPFAFVYQADGDLDGSLTAGLFGDEMRLTVDLAEGHLRGTVVSDGQTTALVHMQKVLNLALPPVTIEEVQFRAGPDTLAATLLRPVGRERPPVAILVPGRGHTDRFGMLGWARLLARNGVAALAWDARGNGGSSGDASSVSSDVLIEDTRAALDWVRTRADLGPVGLLSYSAGSWVAPVVAADRDDVAFVVTLVGPAVSLADQQAHTTVAFMRASGTAYSDEEVQAAFTYQQQTVRLAQANAPWSEFESINASARATRWAEHALIPAAADDPELAYFRRHRFEAPDWARVRAPVLAVFGEVDPLVLPADNVPVLRAALSGNTDVTVFVAPGADHTLARPSGMVGEGDSSYFRPWTRSAAALDVLVRWFATRFP